MRRSVRCTILAAAALAACDRGPETVFVESEGFREELYVVSERGDSVRIRVGEPLVLSASRRSGPWKAVPRASLAAGACWLPTRPMELEAEVAGNLRWTAEPEEGAVFNIDLRPDQTRQVRFDRPGVYVLVAESNSWCRDPFTGPPIFVEVVDE